MAVNNTSIWTYGKRSLALNLGLDVPHLGFFIIANDQKPILGADFLQQFELMVDMSRRQLVDGHIYLHIQGTSSSVSSLCASLSPRDISDPYHALLSEFTILTQVSSPDVPIKSNVVHHIETTGALFMLGQNVLHQTTPMPPRMNPSTFSSWVSSNLLWVFGPHLNIWYSKDSWRLAALRRLSSFQPFHNSRSLSCTFFFLLIGYHGFLQVGSCLCLYPESGCPM